MRLNHVHLGVRDLPAAVAWLDRVWQARPAFQNERMAVFHFGSFILILDSSDQDSSAIVGFESENCDLDCQGVIERGGVAEQQPSDRPWGARAAYIQGPGRLKFEIEQPLK